MRHLNRGIFAVLFYVALATVAQGQSSVSVFLTTADRSALFARQGSTLAFGKPVANLPTIEVDDKHAYQRMEGFGFALTGGSAQLLMRMDAQERSALLKELFATDGDGLGVSYLRVSIGSSDMNDHAFTYDDMPAGQTDPELAKFDFGPDMTTVIPVLKEILAIHPFIRILGSPWSAPAWMKTNDALKDGSLKPEFYPVYAQYLVKYLTLMRAQGINVDAITVQNEPLNPHNTPSMVMQAADQANFIQQALGPAFHKAHIRAKILVYDHNCDRPDYPLTILKDPGASRYVDGSAFHLYGGEITALTAVHDAFPKKNVYFTEQMVVDRREDPKLSVAKPEARLIIGATRNWSRNVLLWNLAADPEFGPHTNDGGCPVCEGAITLNGNTVTRNVAWYVIAHASKFVRPGSVRIESNVLEALPNVAFKTPDGHRVVIVVNTSHSKQVFQIAWRGKSMTATLEDGAVGTYIW